MGWIDRIALNSEGEKMMKTRIIIVGILAAAAVFFFFSDGEKEQAVEEEKVSVKETEPKPRGPKKPVIKRKTANVSSVAIDKKGRRRIKSFRVAQSDGIYRDEEGRAYPDRDQKLFSKLDEASEKDDLASIKRMVNEIASSDNRDLREKAVEALGWFGEKAVADLTVFLSDRDESIAELAHSEWVSGLQQIETDKVKCAAVGMALRSLKKKSMLEDVANELTGVDTLEAVKVVADVIESGGAAVPFAKDVYETISGEKWTGVEAAEKWLQENYDPEE